MDTKTTDEICNFHFMNVFIGTADEKVVSKKKPYTNEPIEQKSQTSQQSEMEERNKKTECLMEILFQEENTIMNLSVELKDSKLELRSAESGKIDALERLQEIESKQQVWMVKEKQMEDDANRLNIHIAALTDERNKNLKELTVVRQELESASAQFAFDINDKSEQLRIADSKVAELRETNQLLMIKNDEYALKLQQQLSESAKLIKVYDDDLNAKVKLAELYKEESLDYKAWVKELTSGIDELRKFLLETLDNYERLDTKLAKVLLELDAKGKIISELRRELDDSNKNRSVNFDRTPPNESEGHEEAIIDVLMEEVVDWEEFENSLWKNESSESNSIGNVSTDQPNSESKGSIDKGEIELKQQQQQQFMRFVPDSLVKVNQMEPVAYDENGVCRPSAYAERMDVAEDHLMGEMSGMPSLIPMFDYQNESLLKIKELTLANASLRKTVDELYDEKKQLNEQIKTLDEQNQANGKIIDATTKLIAAEEQNASLSYMKDALVVEVEALKEELIMEKIANKTLKINLGTSSSNNKMDKMDQGIEETFPNDTIKAQREEGIGKKSVVGLFPFEPASKAQSTTVTQPNVRFRRLRRKKGRLSCVDLTGSDDDENFVNVCDVNSDPEPANIELQNLIERRRQTRRKLKLIVDSINNVEGTGVGRNRNSEPVSQIRSRSTSRDLSTRSRTRNAMGCRSVDDRQSTSGTHVNQRQRQEWAKCADRTVHVQQLNSNSEATRRSGRLINRRLTDGKK